MFLILGHTDTIPMGSVSLASFGLGFRRTSKSWLNSQTSACGKKCVRKCLQRRDSVIRLGFHHVLSGSFRRPLGCLLCQGSSGSP